MTRPLRWLAVLKSMVRGSNHNHAFACVAPPHTKLTDALIRCRDGLIAVGAFSMGINLLVLTVSIYMLQVYDRVLPGRSVETLVYLTIIAAGALGTMGALEVLRSRILVRLGIWIDHVLSPVVFGRGLENTLRGLPYRTEALRDLTTLRSFLGGAGIMALFDAPWLPIFLTLIFLLHPLLGLLSLGGAAVLILLALTNSALTSDKLKRANVALTKGYQNAEAAFRNAEVIDGMGMAHAIIRRWNDLNTRCASITTRRQRHCGADQRLLQIDAHVSANCCFGLRSLVGSASGTVGWQHGRRLHNHVAGFSAG